VWRDNVSFRFPNFRQTPSPPSIGPPDRVAIFDRVNSRIGLRPSRSPDGSRLGRSLTACLPASLMIASPSLGLGQCSQQPARRWSIVRVGCGGILKHSLSDSVARKPLLGSILRGLIRISPLDACRLESGFVNHAVLRFRISLSQGVWKGGLHGTPSLSLWRRRKGLACASC
jgi:hypothetical protein